MGGQSWLGQQITQGVQQGRMQNSPMPPGQQGPPNPAAGQQGNPLSMLPDMEYSGKDGLTIKLSQDHIQSLMGQLQQAQQQQQMKQRAAQMMQQRQQQQQQQGQMIASQPGKWNPPWLPDQQELTNPGYRLAQNQQPPDPNGQA